MHIAEKIIKKLVIRDTDRFLKSRGEAYESAVLYMARTAYLKFNDKVSTDDILKFRTPNNYYLNSKYYNDITDGAIGPSVQLRIDVVNLSGSYRVCEIGLEETIKELLKEKFVGFEELSLSLEISEEEAKLLIDYFS